MGAVAKKKLLQDNDSADFRQIAVYPTSDEFSSNIKPYYLTAQEVFETGIEERPLVHIDNIYRLTREDLIAELRNDWQISQGRKRGKRSALTLESLIPVGVALGNEHRGSKRYSLAVQCRAGLEALLERGEDERRRFLCDNRNYLKHQSFGALHSGQEILSFAFVDRDIDALMEPRPIVILQLTDDVCYKKAVEALKLRSNVMFTVVGTPVFAYEPVLERLKSLTELPLHKTLLGAQADLDDYVPPSALLEKAEQLASHAKDKEIMIQFSGLGKTVQLDYSQRESLIQAITKPVSVIQGPPGPYRVPNPQIYTHTV